MLGAVLAALEPDTPTLRPGVSTRRAKIEAWCDLSEGADFLVI
ncbi:hypothetical protein [Burkholderia cenocepacia]|nr:hypothetical protein [Burkholderia cenocepacia]